ncbi:helix-turn-helix domain-containing protein [Pseudoalteromonas aurantia]|uniref:HTH cro/C1-type domain-containing protein n=1 Tax=Pseudoalteromonas aurantia 208 TaxID=1314867 RepID=A0ABR9EE33_9GAMM|nr:helix-turn-helix domain-containing protein [Pseudoalteromonas aurantia]MBE0369239.1 hypothetical protein [Pseudoalteromonas aurantia 208]
MSTEFSHRLKKIRVHFDKSQIEFAEFLDIPVPSYRKYESGDREPTLNVIQKVFSKKELKPHCHWLITGEEFTVDAELSSVNAHFKHITGKEEYEQAFINETVKSMQMFGYLDWIEINTDKIDLDACGKLLLKDLEPIIEGHYGSYKKSKTG